MISSLNFRLIIRIRSKFFNQKENFFIALSFELEIKIRRARFIKCFKPVEAKMEADLQMYVSRPQSLREAQFTLFLK